MGKAVRTPVQPQDVISQGETDPITMAFFRGATKVADAQQIPQSPLGHYSFDPHAPEFEYIPNATPTTTNTDYFNAERQPTWEKALRGGKQFGVNALSSFGQGLANTFDIVSAAKTIKGELDNSHDDFQSSLFGLTTKEMQDWADGINQRNAIHEKDPGTFTPSDFGWWATQFGSAGTGVGMAFEAIATTAAIEAATGGMGTAAALGKLGSLYNKVTKGAKGLEVMNEAIGVAKGLKSAATLYGTINRYSESRMEATQSYDQIYGELTNEKNEDGTDKFSEEEKKYLASQGANRTFNANMALLPLDILGYRTMVFNPISGSATGLLERGLEKIGNKWLRKGVQGLVFSGLEGTEEGLQFVGSEEGKHYAKVLGGMDDGTSFLQRLGSDVKQDEFWNNFAGGVIGSPIIGGAMSVVNKAMSNGRAGQLNEIHKDFLTNVGKMDNAISDKIKTLEAAGKHQEAQTARRQFTANKALSALHLDAMTDKDSAFDNLNTFLRATLGEVSKGNTDVLKDLGFNATTPEQLKQIEQEFTQYVDDAATMKSIYDNVKEKYNKNFVPQITREHFELDRLMKLKPEIDTAVAEATASLSQFDDLSGQGREIYNTEYKLNALKAEEARLTDLYRDTEDAQEKANIQAILDQNKSNQQEAATKLKEVQADEAYTDKMKSNDNDVLSSALRSPEYAAAIKDQTHLNNAIALKRKNLALWNNEEYQKKKNAESISKAKTKTQVDSTKKDLAVKGQVTPEVNEAIENKSNEIAAQQAAELVEQQEKAKNTPMEIGNDNLFAEDKAFIDAIKQDVVNQSNPVDDEKQAALEPEFLFSPKVIDFDKSSDDAKNRVISGVRGLLNKLDRVDFEDLVRHVVKVQGEATADEIFNALKYGWEKSGHDPVDYEAVYARVFSDPMEQLIGGFKDLSIQTAAELETATEVVTDKIVAKQDPKPEFDNNNQPHYEYKGTVTNESSPKMAFVTRLSEQVLTPGEDGITTVSYEYTEDELNTGSYVDSLQLLDPDKFNEGTPMEVRIPYNFNDLLIPIYNTDGTKAKAMTFGQYAAVHNLTPEMQEYKDKVPMIIYRKGAPANEKGVAFVHDIGWYHPLRFNQENPDDMATAIQNTKDIREEVLNNNGAAPITITGKRQTTFAGMKTKPGETISLKEANPQTILTIATDTESLNTSKKNTIFPNNNSVLINNSPFRKGQVFDVRRYGLIDGKKSFVALPILRPKLDEAVKLTILNAVSVYANRSNKNPEVRAKHDNVKDQIYATMGLDITDAQGLEKYLRHFINTFNTDKATKNEDVENQAKAKLAPRTPYISFIAGGNIVFGVTGEPAYTYNGKASNSFFINPNSSTSPKLALDNLAKDRMLGWYELNVDMNNLSTNKPVSLINKDGSISTVSTSYNDFLLSRLQTNMKSYNIGTPEEPNYVTNVQPVITYELNSKLAKPAPTNTEVAKEVVPAVVETKAEPTTSNAERDALIKEAIEKAKRDLGGSFGITKNNKDLFSPKVLDQNAREEVASTINRIAGLTPDQQFHITDFMYNQITAMVNLDNKIVSKNETDKEVERAFKEVIVPIKQAHLTEIARLEDLMKQFPEMENSGIPDVIADRKYEVAKINAVEASFDVLKEEAYNRVAKYTGITETRTDKREENEPNEETEDVYAEEEPNGKEVDFWTDVLTENPENRLSYAMRRFFGQVRQYDKAGNPMTGFLNLPTYTGADHIIRNLMVTLADVKSDFDTMIAKLESRKEGVPWMAEVINKLKSADQEKRNQFVTVMSNTSLRMKFTMISYNRKNNTWSTKVYDTNLNGVADAVKSEWRNNFHDSGLTIVDDEGKYQLNKAKAINLIQRFESWKGKDIKKVEGDVASLWNRYISKVKNNNDVVIEPTGALLNELKTNIVSNTDRMKFGMKGQNYQVTKVSENKFKVSFLKPTYANKAEVESWLGAFGITLNNNTLNELEAKGMFHNYKQIKWNDLFDDGENTNGLFGILYNKLNTLVKSEEEHDFTEYGDSPLDNSVINSLANLEAKYNDTNTPFGFRDNGKSFFALTAPKFITNRARDLKDPNSDIREQLKSLSFSQASLWLTLMEDGKFREKFGVSHIGANAFKELGKRLYRDNAINKLSDLDHELTKLGMFWDTTQGEVSYVNKEGATHSEYPDSNVGMRMATMFSPTMSDKHLMTLVTTAVLNLKNIDLKDGKGISDEVAKILYDQMVKPELMRMIKFHQNGGATNISGYDKGAGMFLLLPEMNNVEYTPGLKVIDAIKHQPFHFTQSFIEGNTDIMKAFTENIKNYVANLAQEKIEVWKENGIITDGKLKFADKKYIAKFKGTSIEVANMAAMDFVINSMVANANSFMVMAGDPALMFKSKATDKLTQAKDTFINVGKRLANQIAPGTTLSNSENEKYIQVFIQDRISTSTNIEYLEALLGKEEAASYRNIEGSDAQEYTTWKEHLDILTKLGKTPDMISDITPKDIQDARDLFASGTPKSKLSKAQMALLSKVMQPIKPVYTGQLYDPEQDVMRTVYIKSSSFPLIPQLTAGMEIDKLRQKLESLETSHKMNVRASYQTANKVGAVKNAAKIWTENGGIDDAALNDLVKDQNFLILDRKNFRIQQEVPFKSGKTGDDKITLGTQLMKLLFGDEMMNYEGFSYNGKSMTGKELHRIYNDTFIKLVETKRNQLYDELGLDHKGLPIDKKKSMEKLQSILKEEATKRGYPLQDIQGLTLNEQGEFNLPLWASSNSNRYESMLNAIVTNRLIKMKFPGNSYVVGSEEGFIISENVAEADQSRIIYTSAWNGKNLLASYSEDGKIKKAQVLVASKFKDAEGNLIDLFTRVNGEYKYITQDEKGSFKLKGEMFDADLLSLTSFRIPTSGHQSASEIEIAGFLPYENADLMIVPKNFTKQKGLDFDVDKENTYQLWNFQNEDGSYEVLDEKHRNKALLAADKEMQKILKGGTPDDKMIAAMFGDDVTYTKEDLEGNKLLTKLNGKFDEKLMQNEIIKITRSVLSNPSPEVQKKINKTLNTDYAEAQAEFIDGLIAGNKDEKYWTPLSDEYQKSKMALGASGKIGTGAYSLDVVFHSLAQQLALQGTPIEFTEMVGEGETATIRLKTWQFGNIKSTGQIGGTTTLDGGRTISELMSERQNIAVDNEKLQVMGRVNLNDITMDVDKVMNMLGFDKGSDGNSIAFLFLSQPVIREFVDKMKNASSNMAEYDPNKEQTIYDDLLKKYDADNQEEIDDSYWDRMSPLMNNPNLIAQLKTEEPNGPLQGAILRRFMEMRSYGIALRGIQTSVNTDSKGLGKSFFDVIEKRNTLNKLAGDSTMIRGASNLIGEFENKEELTQEEINDLATMGYVDIGKFMVRPTTLSGGFNVHGVATAYNLWSKYFPYDANITNKAFTEILSIIGSDNIGDTKLIQLKQDIFKGMKKYFSASKSNGIIQATDNINEERKRLFIDSEENTSLAKYIKEIKQMTNNNVVNTFIKTNKLFNRFEFDIQKNGQPSLIKYNNAAGEEFDEQYLYESLATLMEVRGATGSVELPKIGNKQYTLDTLAQDLIAYAYLGNAIQEAIQFTKYVPVSYLNQVGYSEKMRKATSWLGSNPNILGLKIGNNENQANLVSEFTMQFVQHNPERVKYKMDAKSFGKQIIKTGEHTFTLKSEDKPVFISVYDSAIPKGEKKFRLYWFDGKQYTAIPVLGTFGMDEYQPQENIGKSLVNGRSKIIIDPQPLVKTEDHSQTTTSPFNIESGDLTSIVDSISKSQTAFAELARVLLPFVNNNVSITTVETDKFNGLYNWNKRSIQIANMVTGKPELLADTVIHELIHSLTIDAINPHITVNGSVVDVSANAPAYVSDLVRVYNSVKSLVGQDKINEIENKTKEGQALTADELANIYPLVNIYEFMTMALTNKDFQKKLNSIPYKQSGKTLLDKFKEAIAKVMTALGVKFDENYTAAHAINNIFQLIEDNNAQANFDPYGQMWTDSTNMDDPFDNEDQGGDPIFSMSPSVDFPEFKLTIPDTECK